MKTFLCGFLECVKCGASVVVAVAPATFVVAVGFWHTLKCLRSAQFVFASERLNAAYA